MTGSTVVNNFTLYHEEKLSSGRPFMSTCVPQSIWVDLYNIEVIHTLDWQHTGYTAPPPGFPDFKLQSRITARGKFIDTITVFRVPEGAVGSFMEIDITIKPLPKGNVGGTNKATTTDGIGMSGMSSKTVPEEGLMVGEPGLILYEDPTQDDWPSERDKPHLILEAYVDEAEMSALAQRITMAPASITKARLVMIAELFQSEVDASLSEPYHRQDYGMLIPSTGRSSGIARARVDHIMIKHKPAAVSEPINEWDLEAAKNKKKPEDLENPGPELVALTSKNALLSIERRLKTISIIVAAGLTFIAISLFLR
jgi:hypothetical protein